MTNTVTWSDPNTTQSNLNNVNPIPVYPIDPTTNKAYSIAGGGGGGGAVTDVTASGTISADQGAVTATFGAGVASWSVDARGTFSAGTTLNFEFSLDGTNWQAAYGVPIGSTADVAVSSAAGGAAIDYQGNAAGFQKFRVRAHPFAAGDSITINIVGSVGTDGGFVSKSLPPGSNTIGTVKVVDSAGSNQLAIDSGGRIADNLQQVGGATITLGSKTSANSLPVVVASDQAAIPVSGTVNAQHATVVSTANSSTSTLTANSVFTGTGESSLNYSAISVEVYADQASAANGLSIQQSQDNSNWDTVDTFTVSASTNFQTTVNLTGQYFRIKYTNGGTNQGTFRLQTIKQTTEVVLPRTLTTLGNLKIAIQEGATSSTATLTSVAGATSGTQLLASNTSRKGMYVYNDSSATMYLGFCASGSVSTTNYTAQIPANGFFEMPVQPTYTGAISAVWSSALGNARITELT